ncbi:MAG: diaminobutyrate acetyltransferase [Natronospirillum sp.]|uniref:diaminobutyrate acetyltransferase n=1 Tax=Natronospirillum sp. TaxID=2812955 RepID=UPI0025FAF509|nr:diaminobutyrate acetyltransferase [Natronospirillum sp.]MCH8551095.1 diaminobutyrate acetyltransferase [Natronospirillum sp.]
MDKQITLRTPNPEDGPLVSDLIANCPPLDTNSRYCNLLQCSHFGDTCVAAWMDDELVGFVSGYILPRQPDTYFLWQIAVAAAARGQNLAQRMIHQALALPACSAVTQLQTTITDDNEASKRVFTKLAERRSTGITNEPFFTREVHFAGQHDTEYLYTIGPFK